MPPKVKIKKEDIINAGVALVRESGPDALNARNVAAKLKCSTQPVFSNYATMGEFKTDVIKAANKIYQKYLEDGMKSDKYPPYKASGMAYIGFAREEKELFKLLFMRDRSEEQIPDNWDEAENLIELVKQNVGLESEEAHFFHLEMWVYVHGIAAMTATSYMDFGEEIISRMLTDVFMSLKERYRQSRGEPAQKQ